MKVSDILEGDGYTDTTRSALRDLKSRTLKSLLQSIKKKNTPKDSESPLIADQGNEKDDRKDPGGGIT